MNKNRLYFAPCRRRSRHTPHRRYSRTPQHHHHSPPDSPPLPPSAHSSPQSDPHHPSQFARKKEAEKAVLKHQKAVKEAKEEKDALRDLDRQDRILDDVLHKVEKCMCSMQKLPYVGREGAVFPSLYFTHNAWTSPDVCHH